MKVAKIALAACAASALVLTGCSSSGSGSSTSSAAASESASASASESASASDSGGGAAAAKYKVCEYTHGDGGSFWSVAKKGALQAQTDYNGVIEVDYQESNNDAAKQAQLIEAGISGGCKAIIVSAPDPGAIKDALKKAEDAGIPVFTMNSGSKSYKELGAITHVGQDEFVAGQGAGEKFKEMGLKKVLCPIHEASNVGLQERCQGLEDTFGKENVVELQVTGLADPAKTGAEIQAKLEADPAIDGIFALNADIATKSSLPAVEAVGRPIKIGTVDLSGEAVQAIKDGKLEFAIDQQQFTQGYLPIVFAYLYLLNNNTVGGGLPVNTGPGFVTKDNADQVLELAANGTR